MFKGTLCRKITFYLINNFYEKKSLKLILTRLGIFNFVLIIVEKELFENETDNSKLKTYLKDIFEDKRGQSQN